MLHVLPLNFFIQFVTVANRISFFKMRCYFSVIGQSFNTVAAYPVVDQPAMFIPPKIVSKNGPSIKRMYPFTRHMKGKFTPSHPKEIVMDVIVTYKGKTGFTEAEIEINAVVMSAKIPSAVNKVFRPPTPASNPATVPSQRQAQAPQQKQSQKKQ